MTYTYDYQELEKELALFRLSYPQVPVFSIGKSREGRNLYGIKLGRGEKRIFFHGAHHGMEWLTSKLLMQFAFDLAGESSDSASLLSGRCLYLLPMVNPDGVEIAKTGKRWQANAAGVDLNHNYDALWHLSKQAEEDAGVFGPGPTRFSGAFPES